MAWINKRIPRLCKAFLPLFAAAMMTPAVVDASFAGQAQWQVPEPVFSRQDSLFIVAATGEPRFQIPRDSCEKILVTEGDSTLRYVLMHRLTAQTPRQTHYVEHLFTLIADSGRHPIAARRLAEALPTAPDSVKIQLLQIGSELGDSAFLVTARKYLQADSVEVRKRAVRCLGKYPSTTDLPYLLNGLEQTQGLERYERLWALTKQPSLSFWPQLLPLLRDERLFNRQMIRQIVLRGCEGNWEQMEKFYPTEKNQADAERLEWVLMAGELSSPAARRFLEKEIPHLDADVRKFIVNAKNPSGF